MNNLMMHAILKCNNVVTLPVDWTQHAPIIRSAGSHFICRSIVRLDRRTPVCHGDLFLLKTWVLEALSRGGRFAVLIEQDHRAWELLKENVSALKAEDETLCWRTNALRSSFKPKGIEAWRPYDIVFFDPPYRYMDNATADSEPYKALTRLAREDTTAENVLLVVRTAGKATFEMPPQWTLQECLKPSSMALHFFVKTSSLAEPAVESE